MDLSPDMTQEKLEKTVKRKFQYIDKRLLSGKSAEAIEESGNQQAIDILQSSRDSRDQIADWISHGQFENAYGALKKLGHSMRQAMQLTRAKEVSAKKIKNAMDSARIANDTYFELIKKRGDTNAGRKTIVMIEQAHEARTKADELQNNNDFQKATEYYLASTKLLKNAVATLRDM